MEQGWEKKEVVTAIGVFLHQIKALAKVQHLQAMRHQDNGPSLKPAGPTRPCIQTAFFGS